MATLNNPAGFLISGATASGAAASTVQDTRHAANYGYLWYATPAVSARIDLQVSHDSTGWMTHSIYTATTTTGTAQLAAYFPYIRATILNRYGASTAYAWYSPGLT